MVRDRGGQIIHASRRRTGFNGRPLETPFSKLATQQTASRHTAGQLQEHECPHALVSRKSPVRLAARTFVPCARFQPEPAGHDHNGDIAASH